MSKIQLKDICCFSKGSQINGDELIDNGEYDYLNGGINPSGKWSDFNVSGGSITISEGGNSCGYVNYMPAPFWCGAHCYYLYDLRCEVKYLYYALKSQQDRIMKLRSGACMPNIKKSDIGSFTFEYTEDTGVQSIIVSNLDKVTHTIDLCNAILEKLDLLVKSRFVEMFGDPITNSKGWKMVDLGELTSVGSSKRIFEKEYVESGIPFYRTKEIVELSKGNPITTELFIPEKRYAEIKKQYGVPKKGDLLISAVGTIGVIWIVDGENDFYFKDGNLIQVDGTNRFNSSYMKWLLEYLIADYKKQMSAGTAYAALTISGLSKMQVYDVPIDLQQQFAAFVEQTDKSKFIAININKIIRRVRFNDQF